MMRYHGTPFAGRPNNTRALSGKHAMVSFARPDDIDHVAEVCQSFCLDNGAFSAWKSGVDYNFDGYTEWAFHWLRHPGCDFAIIPDVIDGSEEENDKFVDIFRSKNPAITAQFVPVWHLHESIERLVNLALSWPRVALGSSGEYSTVGDPRWWSRMAEAMDAITDDSGRPITRLHGLRMLDPGIFSYIPFASADSTNVARNIGIDKRWEGPYVPSSQLVRAIVMMDRIESHAAATWWRKGTEVRNQQNLDLLG